jgi:Recombinase zinc beta ribbon domain
VIAGYSASLRGDIVHDEMTGEPLRPWEGVVDLSVWHKLQSTLADRGPGRGPLSPETTLLGGLDIFLCAHCGGRMAGDRRKDGGGNYRCSRHRRGSARCNGAAVAMAHLDRHVVSEVFGRFTGLDENVPEDRDLLRAVALRYNAADEDPEIAEARRNTQAMIDDALNALDRLDDDRTAGVFVGEMGQIRYRRQVAGLTERLTACQARLKDLPHPTPPDDISIILEMRDEFRRDDAGAAPEDPRSFFYNGWTVQERREFITTLLDGILITKGTGRQGGTSPWRGGDRVHLVWTGPPQNQETDALSQLDGESKHRRS